MNKFSIAVLAVLSATLLFSCESEEALSKPIQGNTKQEATTPLSQVRLTQLNLKLKS